MDDGPLYALFEDITKCLSPGFTAFEEGRYVYE